MLRIFYHIIKIIKRKEKKKDPALSLNPLAQKLPCTTGLAKKIKKKKNLWITL